MNRSITAASAWQRTVGQLDAGCALQWAAHVRDIVDSHESSRPENSHGNIAITLLERISPKTATVSWSDPRGCKYGEQIWRVATARRSGICALSGQAIAAGDAIYRPTKANPPPTNAAAMMLASVVERRFAGSAG